MNIPLHFMYYNFIKIHGTVRCTPAMAAGVTDRLWDMLDVIKLVEEREAALKLEVKNRSDAYARFGGALGHGLG